jgi:NAD(P)-dependent dehydrogenase (short-subunit alcohol dehydrogenase family)
MAKGHQGKTALITGAASGLGAAFAKRLAEDGVDIAAVDLHDASATVKAVQAAGRKAQAFTCDVSSPESVDAMAADVGKTFPKIDIVINCAGIFPQVPLENVTYAEWRRIVGTNLDGTFLVSMAFVPGMKARGWGRIITLSSSTVGSVVTGFVPYVASKLGIVGFTRALASELGTFGITVNAIQPGLTKTPGATSRPPRAGFATMDDEFADVAAKFQAIKRVETPDDLTGAVSFLTSDDAAFITGQTMAVDGGRVRL